ncbi:hypothetical protein ALC62_03438, partial [Cyphomyrmex costatus]
SRTLRTSPFPSTCASQRFLVDNFVRRLPGKREEDPLPSSTRELPSASEELITSAISPSLDAAEDHDFRRDPS